MKNTISKLLNKLTGLTPANLKVDKLIEITAKDPFQRMQETRKRNLQRIVQIYYNSDIAEYAKSQEKNIHFLMGMFKPFTSRLCRPITTKTARLIECHMRLETGILDMENDPEFHQNYVPFIDNNTSFANNFLSFSGTKPNQYFDPTKYNPKLLVILDTEGLEFVSFSDSESNGYINSLGDQYLINRNTNKKVQIFKRYGSEVKIIEFNGEILLNNLNYTSLINSNF